MDTEEHLEKVAELELQYEDLEQKYYLHICALIGIILHLYLGNWLVTIIFPLAVFTIFWKYLAKRPFTSNVGSIEEKNI